MITKIIARILGKKLFMSEITILKEEFTATHYSDSLLESLKWTLHGIYESSNLNNDIDNSSNKLGVFGQIREFKIFKLSKSSISFCGYPKPKAEETLFMTNQMVYIPQNILKNLKKQEVSVSELDTMFKK